MRVPPGLERLRQPVVRYGLAQGDEIAPSPPADFLEGDGQRSGHRGLAGRLPVCEGHIDPPGQANVGRQWGQPLPQLLAERRRLFRWAAGQGLVQPIRPGQQDRQFAAQQSPGVLVGRCVVTEQPVEDVGAAMRPGAVGEIQQRQHPHRVPYRAGGCSLQQRQDLVVLQGHGQREPAVRRRAAGGNGADFRLEPGQHVRRRWARIRIGQRAEQLGDLLGRAAAGPEPAQQGFVDQRRSLRSRPEVDDLVEGPERITVPARHGPDQPEFGQGWMAGQIVPVEQRSDRAGQQAVGHLRLLGGQTFYQPAQHGWINPQHAGRFGRWRRRVQLGPPVAFELRLGDHDAGGGGPVQYGQGCRRCGCIQEAGRPVTRDLRGRAAERNRAGRLAPAQLRDRPVGQQSLQRLGPRRAG